MYTRRLILIIGACCTVIGMLQASCYDCSNSVRAEQVFSLSAVSAKDGAKGTYLLLPMGKMEACRVCLTGWK